MSIQGFKNYVFFGSLCRFNIKLQNELALFWDKTREGGMGWCRCCCEKGFEGQVIPQSTKEAPRCN